VTAPLAIAPNREGFVFPHKAVTVTRPHQSMGNLVQDSVFDLPPVARGYMVCGHLDAPIRVSAHPKPRAIFIQRKVPALEAVSPHEIASHFLCIFKMLEKFFDGFHNATSIAHSPKPRNNKNHYFSFFFFLAFWCLTLYTGGVREGHISFFDKTKNKLHTPPDTPSVSKKRRRSSPKIFLDKRKKEPQ
jgi:hypothetical protein